MNKENEAKIAKARREMERINAEWEALNVECKLVLGYMADLEVKGLQCKRFPELLEIAQAKRSALGDQHAAAMAVYFDAVTAHLKEVSEGATLPQETQKGESK